MSKIAALAVLSGLVVLAAPSARAAEDPVKRLDIELKDAKGGKVGTARLTEADGGVRVSVRAKGLAPGKHGIHFHETGKCEGPDFKSAGSHLNPAKKEHGLGNPKGSHAGDLPNLEAGPDGSVVAELTSKGAKLSGGADSLLKDGGTALVIHAKGDDQKTSPSGDSGDRVACGVITR